ncbi:MAG: hypothetical protein ACHQZS_07975 [Candidatus Binatales bacterium]
MRSWLRETGRLYVMYLAAGAAFLPFAFLYASLKVSGRDDRQLLILSVLGGLIFAFVIWSTIDRRWQLHDDPEEISAAAEDIEREAEALGALAREAMASLRAGTERIEVSLARLQELI